MGENFMKIIVAERIRELMKAENLTQVALASKIGVKQNTISAWVLGKKSLAFIRYGYWQTILTWK